MPATFGIDFGTTNSLAAVVGEDPDTGRSSPRLLTREGRPHPSVVWYDGLRTVVGLEAKLQLPELGLGVFGDIVRSPKMFLGDPTGIYVGGARRQPLDVVADLLMFIREDALSRQFENEFASAVITIPVSMNGTARSELRQAALKAGIKIHQFVHEPLAALYGYLRAQQDFENILADIDDQLILVFDWGGGTLDLTLCKLQDGVLRQIYSKGSRDVGGDKFDRRLHQVVRHKHESQYPNADWSQIQPSAEPRLIQTCEDAKIALSSREMTAFFMNDLLATDGPEKDIRFGITRLELEGACKDLISAGLEEVNKVLSAVGIDRSAIEFCLATGGMLGVPAIQDGLREIFGFNQLRIVENSATVIAEGAAWIAYDELPLQLAKPIELLHADNSYVQIFAKDTKLPNAGTISERLTMFCVDPRDGFAKFLFARPRWPGRDEQGDERLPYALMTLPVDHHSDPLLERLQIDLSVDCDLIVNIEAVSLMRGERREVKIQDLEFGIDVSALAAGSGNGRVV